MQRSIGISVKEVLEFDTFKDSEILCGHSGLDNIITTVNVIEVPDIINWVKEGEFLLTTAYSIKDDLSQLNEWIPMMKEIGVSGIGIKTKRYIDTLPNTVIKIANELNFPIINIPYDMSFGEAIKIVLTTILNRQTNLLMQIGDFNDKIKDIMLRGGGLSAIAGAIRDLVNGPVAITEYIFKDYVIVADDEDVSQLSSIVERDFIQRAGKRYHNMDTYDHPYDEDEIHGKKVKRLVIPIYSANTFYGYVVIWDINNTVSKSSLFIIEAAVSLIALNSAKKLSIYENENKHKIEFIEDLLSDDYNKKIRAMEKAPYFNFDPKLVYCAVVVSLNPMTKDVHYTRNNSEIFKQLTGKLITVVQRIQRYYSGRLIYANKSDRVIFLLGFNHDVTNDEMKGIVYQFSKDILNFSKLVSIENQLYIGSGRAYADYKDLYKSYREANRVIQNLSFFNTDNKIFHFDDLGIYRILSHEDVQPELEQFFTETLGPIIAYDKEKDAELLRTLQCYFECGCNLKKVSEEMYTHYNTIIYRMQRIKEIGKIDLNDPDTALNVHVAIKSLHVLSPNVDKE